MPLRPQRPHRLGLALLSVLMLVAIGGPGQALAGPSGKVVRYHGYRLVVPAAWPVYRLQSDPTACVRFDRHAVYLGQPTDRQRCPAVAIGRTEAILVQPLNQRSRQIAAQLLPVAAKAPATMPSASAAQLVDPGHGVIVSATWNRRPALIRRMLGIRSLAALARESAQRPHPAAVVSSAGLTRSEERARAATGVSEPGQVYTGAGFDACNTPSSSQMAAWSASPYRALGVYIGGENRACSQPNLTSAWVDQQSGDGWHLIPTYVGLQAPSNSCGCAPISPSSAAAEGTSDAQTAVADAQAIGLGAGNPLYLDMENYTRNTTDSSAVLAYIQAWTEQLHADGYLSGVYSSSDSGIVDLVDTVGTGYVEPDDIWIANWNGSQSTADANVPTQDWAAHQRIHQYEGAHNETYQGVKINIDGDYLDAATAAAGVGSGAVGTPTPAATPSLAIEPTAAGAIDLTPSWSYATGITSWQLLAGSDPAAMAPLGTPVSVGARLPIVSQSDYAYFAVAALNAAGQTLGTSPALATPAHLVISGQSVFTPRQGLGGVPVGCFSATPCTGVTTTISAGRRTLVKTGAERIPPGAGLAYFSLTPAEHQALWLARHHQESVKITEHAASGLSVTRQLALTSFSTTDPSPRRSIADSRAVHIVGTSDFVSNGWVGGILAQCVSSSPCQAITKIVADGRVIAQTHALTLGVDQLGYLMFTLTSAGHQLLAKAPGNQLPATVTINSSGFTATGHLALSAYN